ncbi:MAG: baeRF3 domain-containing protein [Wenzhouxiangella sp.]
MNRIDQDAAAGRWDEGQAPCLSLFQPTHRSHPDNQQDPIRFRNLVKTLEESLLKKFDSDEIEPLLEPLLALAENRAFWNCTHDGLAVLRDRNQFRVYRLQRPVAALAVVADSFHTKPLLRILQSADRYQVLAVNRNEIKLFEGNRDALDEIEPAEDVPRTMTDALGDELTEGRQTVGAYGGLGRGQAGMHHGHGGRKDQLDHDAERFFRVIDRAVFESHSKHSKLPLLLASLPQHHHMFHELSHNPCLIPESLDVHPDALESIDEFRQRVWQTIQPRYLARLAELADAFSSSKPKGLGDDDLKAVAKAAVEGRVATLLIEARREIPGRVDTTTGALEFDELSNPEMDDVLDDLGALTQTMGGEVVVVPTEQMPTETGIAAIYRY